MRTSKAKVNYAAFLPNSKGKTSVYRTSNSSEDEVWRIGRDYVLSLMPRNDQSQRRLRARGDITAELVFEKKLTVEPDPAPHPLHANIANWPDEKSDQIEAARGLAQNSKLVLNPNP